MEVVPQIDLCSLARTQGHDLAGIKDAAFLLHGISGSGSEQGGIVQSLPTCVVPPGCSG